VVWVRSPLSKSIARRFWRGQRADAAQPCTLKRQAILGCFDFHVGSNCFLLVVRGNLTGGKDIASLPPAAAASPFSSSVRNFVITVTIARRGGGALLRGEVRLAGQPPEVRPKALTEIRSPGQSVATLGGPFSFWSRPVDWLNRLGHGRRKPFSEREGGWSGFFTRPPTITSRESRGKTV